MYLAIERPSLSSPWRRAFSETNGGKGKDGDRLRVLIVEDEAVLAMDMESSLTQSGFDIVGIADSEREAVLLVDQQRPDLVLMDITLRDGDGLAAARAIAGREARIIFVSASSDPTTLAAAKALRPIGFIRKPYASHELPGILKKNAQSGQRQLSSNSRNALGAASSKFASLSLWPARCSTTSSSATTTAMSSSVG